MNRKSGHIAAFTIWEVLVAMLITSLLVGLSYKAYQKAGEALTKDTGIQDKLDHMVMLQKRVSSEIMTAESIYLDEGGIVIDSKEPWHFEILDSTLVISNWAYSYEKTFGYSSLNFDYLNDTSVFISKISIKLIEDGISYPLLFYKSYSKSFLYKLYNHEYRNK